MLEEQGVGVLASFTGRHFGLDRDGHWDRTELAYRAMTATEPSSQSLDETLSANYEQGHNDEHLQPIVLGPQAHPVQNNDALVFIDFREDSIRQIASAFILSDFDKFKTAGLQNVCVATMTDYSKKFSVAIAFPNEEINKPIGKVLSDAGKTQMLVAETEKYAHVTYFFNGYRDEPFPGQFRVLIPSRNVDRHDEHPEMMAEEITNRILEAVEDKSFDFIVANLANPDMIAHTGNFEAALKAIQVVDRQVGRIVKACELRDANLIITSDHGNAEKMSDSVGGVETSHDSNPVPLYLVSRDFVREKNEAEVAKQEQEVVGILSDVAPTILALMGVAQPVEMTGKNLLKYL
ncbi:MAG: 2,3-bisphosphoglycerate-independent phosphoglycerate mutase, partial [bacterium]|nr:2,3-bisphosphoglycerate-independent phosphoglycerate mutase [bacterium]